MRKALVVDDHEENVYLLSAVLSANGYQVRTAGDGAEALALASADTPDLIVSDILMPVMDGFSFCRACRADEQLRSVPFVFYTATYTDPADEQLALDAGADLFLVKPLEPELFLERIGEVVHRWQTGGLRHRPAAAVDDVSYLKEYNAALVRKLEDKVADLEDANRALAIKEFAIESSPSGLLMADPEGRVTYANRAAADLLGRTAASLTGCTLEEVFPGTSWGEAVLHIASSGRWSGELATEAGGADLRTFDVSVHSVSGGDGQLLCRMVALQDVTERRRMAEEVQRSQRVASLSLFAAGVAHDFNNLLTGVFGNIELAVHELPEDHPARTHLADAGAAFSRARDLTRRLLAFAKSSPPSRRPLAVVDLLRECCTLALAGSSVKFELRTSPCSRTVRGDANQLSRVFTNILVNARQAMNGSGRVVIDVAPKDVAAEDGPPICYLCITVTDEGPGLSAEAMRHLFDPLFTTKPDGSGLGLATCYAIVEAHGGWLEADTAPERGASFRVFLPAECATDAVEEPAVARPDVVPLPRVRVIVMDDEPLVRNLAARMLTVAGCEVTTAADGAEVLTACEQAARDGRPFHAAVLDVTVPGAMGGLETLDRLQVEYSALPVILSSGYGHAAAVSGTPPAAVLPKPYQMHELLACVRAVTGNSGTR